MGRDTDAVDMELWAPCGIVELLGWRVGWIDGGSDSFDVGFCLQIVLFYFVFCVHVLLGRVRRI
jgi:hypothetical protein